MNGLSPYPFCAFELAIAFCAFELAIAFCAFELAIASYTPFVPFVPFVAKISSHVLNPADRLAFCELDGQAFFGRQDMCIGHYRTVFALDDAKAAREHG